MAKEISEELQTTPDLIIGNYSDGNIVALLLAQKLGVTMVCSLSIYDPLFLVFLLETVSSFIFAILEVYDCSRTREDEISKFRCVLEEI